jgi:hypothetical protein
MVNTSTGTLVATNDTANTGLAFGVVGVEVSAGHRVEVSAQLTGCADLVIAPSVWITASGQPAFDDADFTLVQASTAHPVASANRPQALLDLARRLSWFDPQIIDPDYLADPANAGVLASIKELLQQWRAEEARADIPPRIVLT